MVVLCISSLVFVFLFKMMRHVGTGMTRVQRWVPLQRDIHNAKQAIEKDLLSAPRISIGNAAPNPGFEEVPTRLSTTTPTTDGFWSCPPTPPRRGLGINKKYMQGYINARPDLLVSGHYSLNIDIRDMTTDCFAYSSTFTLFDNTGYLFAGWIKKNIANARFARIELLGDANSWPNTSLAVLPSNSSNWTFVVATMTTGVGHFYRIQAGAVNGQTARMAMSFDDIILTPLTINLLPGDPPYEFQRVLTTGPNVGRRERLRYRLVPHGNSGRLIRERWDGAAWGEINYMDNIRRLRFAWDFSRGVSGGGMPPPAQWPALFGAGMNFPMTVTIEAGPVGAMSDKSLSLTYSVYSGVP